MSEQAPTSRAEVRRLRDLASAVKRGDFEAAAAIATGLDVPQRRPAPRRLLVVTPEVDALLARVGNASEYVCALVRDASDAWRAGLSRLRECGWDRHEILAACEALSRLQWIPFSPDWIAAQLSDVESVVADAAEWRTRVKEVSQDEALTRALLLVAAEYWRGNRDLEQAIDRLGAREARIRG